ncbi:MAG TPA: hypothetical protein VIL46_15755, partial [Gemmataceae bacterium]
MPPTLSTHPRTNLWPLLAALGLFLAAGESRAQLLDLVCVKVEEEWEIVLSQPDFSVATPQVTISTKPNPNSEFACEINLNHRTGADSASTTFPGGLQMVILRNEKERLAQHTLDGLKLLSTTDETITWTQSISRDGSGNLVFEILRFTSGTWGSYNGLKLQVSSPTSLLNLGVYDPNVAIQRTGILFGSNRVKSLKLVKVKRY